MMSWKDVVMAGLLSAGLMISAPGCGGDGDDGDGTSVVDEDVNSVVGTWQVQFPGDPPVFWVFGADGSWDQFDDAALQGRHLGGTYVQTGNAFSGPCANPGVGQCDIEGTISEDGQTIAVDFIEHWHSPSKHVPLSGARLE